MKTCSKCYASHDNASDLCPSCTAAKRSFEDAISGKLSATTKKSPPIQPVSQTVVTYTPPSQKHPAPPAASYQRPPNPVNLPTLPAYQTPTLPSSPPVPSLPICLIMDIIGMSSYSILGLGELADAVWAPISGIIFLIMFRRFGALGLAGAVGALAEEALPFTDIVPSFTIGYFLARRAAEKNP